MKITVSNECLQLTVDSRGAQMMSIRHADGTQYLWQGDPRYWSDRAPLLFPYIARLTNDSYYYKEKLYHMGIHGFAASADFTVVKQSADSVTLELLADQKTRAQYPFAFQLQVTYSLNGTEIDVSYAVRNLDEETMPFGIGGHPGFRVPLEEGESFEDYTLEFSCACQPDRVGFTPQVYLSGTDCPYPLEQKRFLPLKHSLFDDDAVILKNMAKEVRLTSGVSGRGVQVSYPDMAYLGLWHWPKTDAPYLCIEPWTSLPSRQGVVEEISCKSDLIHLAPGKTYETTWSITVF